MNPAPALLPPALAGAYLRRLGFDAPLPASVESLRRLHRAHLGRVPFENLDIHMGVPIVLDAEAFAAKIAERSRGGFCYELNGAFASLLATLGFDVRLMEARVHSPAGLGARFGHLCVAVHLDGGPHLVDVGFGRGGFVEPIRLEAGVRQPDTAGEFVLEPAGDGTLDVVRDGAREYRFTSTSRRLEDFAPGCTFHQTSPDSAFTRGTICTIRTQAGRTTLAGLRLIETAAAGRVERAIDPADLRHVLRERFAIGLDGAAIARLAGVGASPVAGVVR